MRSTNLYLVEYNSREKMHSIKKKQMFYANFYIFKYNSFILYLFCLKLSTLLFILK